MRFLAEFRKAFLRIVLTFWRITPLCLVFQLHAGRSQAALPDRLVILLDGVAYGDLKALQTGGLSEAEERAAGGPRAFHEGYFPVSRLVSTFPSASDVAWTEILGNPPLPG